jgi:hypothetical protein
MFKTALNNKWNAIKFLALGNEVAMEDMDVSLEEPVVVKGSVAAQTNTYNIIAAFITDYMNRQLDFALKRSDIHASCDLPIQILRAHNIIRADPTILLDTLEERLSLFAGDAPEIFVITHDKKQYKKRTKEGVAGVQEAIDYIKSVSEVDRRPLQWSEELAKAALQHAIDLKNGDAKWHKGSDDSTPFDR